MIFPTEKSAWGIFLADSKLKGKSGFAGETVKDQTGSFGDAVNAMCLSSNCFLPNMNTVISQTGNSEKPQNELSDERIFKDPFENMTGKVNISGESPVVGQSRDLIGIDKKDDLQNCQDEKHAASLSKEIQRYGIDQINAGGTALSIPAALNSKEEGIQDNARELGIQQVIQPGFKVEEMEKWKEIQNPVPERNWEEIEAAVNETSNLLGVASSDLIPEEILGSTPDQSQVEFQPQGEIDRLQSIVGDSTPLEIAPLGLERKGIAKFETEQSSAGIAMQGNGSENNKNDNAGHIQAVQADTWVSNLLETVEASTNYTQSEGSVVQLFAASKNSGRISASENAEDSNGDEKVAGLQRQSDLLQNLAGSLSKSTGISGSAVSKQESVMTYQQVPIAELPSVVLSALRSSGSGEKLIRINLIPENLGPLTIKVKEIKDKLVIHFIASSSDAKDILEGSIPQLKQSIIQLSGSTNETLVFLSQEQNQGQGKDNNAQGGWNYFKKSLTRLSNDTVGAARQTFENGINSQSGARTVNYWV